MSGGSVDIRRSIIAPTETVATYIGDFRNAREWMAGIRSIEQLGEDFYQLKLETPIGSVEPEAKIIERTPSRIRWVYTSTVDGDGLVEVSPNGQGTCMVHYVGHFRIRGRILSRAAKAVGIERFARRMGERSLDRLKHLMEARRHS